MRLKKAQKEKVIEWAAAGLQTDEINKLAVDFDPQFSVTRQQVDHYRKSRNIKIGNILEQAEQNALTTGLGLKEERVKLLKSLAEDMIQDLTRKRDNRRWVTMVKGIGSRGDFERVEYEEFNKAEMDSLRGVLDDIAREVGDRVQKNEHSGPDGGPIPFDMDEWKSVRKKRLKQVASMPNE